MSEVQQQNAGSEIPAEETQFLAGVEPRILRAIWVLGVAGMAACWLWRDWSWAAGFAIGAILSALNFLWMKAAIGALAAAAVSSSSGASHQQEKQSKGRSAGAVARFVLRYALIALAGYAILHSSDISLGAFFLGLFLAIVAILVEIAYQIYLAFRST